jgi:hypothetical protein
MSHESPPVFNGPTDPHGYGQEVPPVTRIGPFVIGYVGRIHGEEGRPCPEYIPTKHELRVLARHWEAVIEDHESYFEETGVSGSTEAREILYAAQRVDSIVGLIGTEDVMADWSDMAKANPEAVIRNHVHIRTHMAGELAKCPISLDQLRHYASLLSSHDAISKDIQAIQDQVKRRRGE